MIIQVLNSIKFLFLFIACLCLGDTPLTAQENSLVHKCGHSLLMMQMEEAYPGYQERVSRIFAEAKLNGEFARSNDEVYKIKVVVHVVWREEEENIHDSLIISQIETLTEDFRLKNPDRFGMRKIFVNRQADAKIEFELHEIRRIQTNSSFTPLIITLPDQVKSTAEGGSDGADPEHFLNIWVCKLQPIPFIGAQVFGYAYPPADLPNWPAGANAPSLDLEGVVIDYRCIGKNTPFVFDVPGFDDLRLNGRTLTHEVGHYLGLRHIWGDGGGLFGGDSCEADDGVEDTPNSGRASSQDCDKSQNTCTEEPGADEPDMIENYMDYSSEFCMNSFTIGQVAIMRSVLEGPRAGLLEETSVGTSENGLLSNVQVFPNPACNKLFIKGATSVRLMMIRDIHGRIVMNLNEGSLSQSASLDIDISRLMNGIYFLHVFDGNVAKTMKFVVSK